MSDLPSYSHYKESGVEWLGKIPSHWQLIKNKFILDFSKGLTITKENLIDEGIPCVNYGEVHSKFGFEVDPNKHSLKCVPEIYLNDCPNALLKNGDFVFADTSEDIKGSGNFTYLNSEVPTFAGYHTIIARINNASFPRYLAYVFDCDSYRNQIRAQVKGVKVFSITQFMLKNSLVWLPPLEEQKAITNYLDKKLTQIDTLITKQQALLEKLAEQRLALISHAVTKGLNPDVEMKESGVEWLGEIPSHWAVIAFHYISLLKSGQSVTSLDFITEGEYPVYGGNGFRGYIDRYNHNGNYILIGRQGALCGNINVASGKFFATEHAIVVYPTKEFDLSWLYYLLDAMNLNQYSTSAAQPGISAEVIGRLRIPFPSLSEQKRISDYLDSVLTKIKSIELSHIECINRLKEYRSALITQAVTGKIDVRNLAN